MSIALKMRIQARGYALLRWVSGDSRLRGNDGDGLRGNCLWRWYGLSVVTMAIKSGV